MNARENTMLFFTFALGIAIEAYYVWAIMMSGSPPEVITERAFIAGFIISIWAVLIVNVLRQKRIIDILNMQAAKRPDTRKRLKKDLGKLYRDLGAIRIVYNDDLMSAQDYGSKKAGIEKEIARKKKQLDSMRPEVVKTRPKKARRAKAKEEEK